MTDPKILAWFVGAGVCSSILMWHFQTRLLSHILDLTRNLLFWWKGNEFWILDQEIGGKVYPVEIGEMTSDDLTEWVRGRFGGYTAELISCPGCFSAHVSWWVAVGIQLFTGLDLLYFLSCWLTWPIISNLFLAYLKR